MHTGRKPSVIRREQPSSVVSLLLYGVMWPVEQCFGGTETLACEAVTVRGQKRAYLGTHQALRERNSTA